MVSGRSQATAAQKIVGRWFELLTLVGGDIAGNAKAGDPVEEETGDNGLNCFVGDAGGHGTTGKTINTSKEVMLA